MAKIPISESGRSGRAGYTDPNNNDLNQRDKFGRDRDGSAEGLVGFHELHRRLLFSRIQYKRRKCNTVMSLQMFIAVLTVL